MKKYLLFLITLLIPFLVKAEDTVKIEKVELLDKSNTVEILEQPEFNGLKVNFNIKFTAKDEYVTYKVTITNNSNKDYEIGTEQDFKEGEYISYEFKYDNNSKVIKAGAKKTVIITMKYANQVPVSLFNSGNYTEKNKMTFSLSDENKNPYTASGIPIVILTICLLALFITIALYKKKQELLFSLVLVILIPLTVYAIEKLTLEVETDVVIEPVIKDFVITSKNCSSDIYEDNHYEYVEGATLEDFILSPYSDSFFDKYYPSLKNEEPEDKLYEMFRDNNYERSWRTYSDELDECINQVEYVPKAEDYDGYYDYVENYYNCLDETAYETLTKDSIIKPSTEGKIIHRKICLS